MSLLNELRRRWWIVLIGIVLLLLVFGARIATFYTDVLWFETIGFVDVFWTLLGTRIGLGLAAGLLMAVLLAGNLLLAKRLAPPYRIPSPQEESVERYREAVEPFARPLLLSVAVFIGLLTGLSMVGEWQTYLLWANATEFGRVDPQFGRDLGYFVFVLPFHVLVNSYLFTSLALATVLTAIAHYLFGGIRPQAHGRKVTPQVYVHLSVLLAALAAVRAWGFLLDRYMLSYSPRGQVTGLSYTDVNANLRAFQLLALIAAVTMVLFLVNIWVRSFLLPATGVGILLVASVVLSGVYPTVIQRLQVDPQELPREEEFIQRNLDMTRYAFDIDDVNFEPFPAQAELDEAAVVANQRTLESIRLWDPETLQNTYQQLQELRPYYDFRDVDVDRYMLDDDLTQVMISVREISVRDLPPSAQTWQNERLVYTHGFGVVASNVSTARPDGQPVFFVNNIPPQGVEELTIDNPRVYFGENPPEYSIVGSRQAELDYPLQEGRQEVYRYTGEDGVVVGSPLRRLSFALRYAEPNFVLSNLIVPESKILFRRNIRDRVESVAPFLKLDHDPYAVAVDGRVKWVLDAYTTTDMVPYSERVDLAALTPSDRRIFQAVPTADGGLAIEEVVRVLPGLEGSANYIRNSVKAVVDAYDGTVELYVVDPEDPLIQTWQQVFPDSFTPVEEASDELRAHFRYPEDMFRVQAALFSTYHIQEAADFYYKEDAWSIPPDAAYARNQQAAGRSSGSSGSRTMRPYYLLMRLPGQETEEFALIQPFTPRERPNLIAWLAGRSDGEFRGQLKAYVMPPDRTVFGPGQIQARVDQEETIAQQIALWNQSGSRVIYGNLLVIPVEEALLYAQPLFLRAQQGEIPELRAVVLILGDTVVMEESLSSALRELFGDAIGELTLPPDAADGPSILVPDGGEFDPRVAELISQAIARFAAAEAALREGDLGTYQSETREAERLLREAQTLMSGDDPDADDATDPPAGSGAGADGGANGGANASPTPAATESPPATTDA